MPLLSICIPSYKNAEGLRRLLDSMHPLPSDVEIVVSKNASTDRIDDVLRDFLKKLGSRLTIHTQDRNVGGIANIAGLPTLATGEYVWVISENNAILPVKNIQVVIDYIRKNAPMFLVVNRLFVRKHCVEQEINAVNSTAPNMMHWQLFMFNPTFVLPVERRVFSDFNETVDYFFHYFQTLGVSIFQRNFLKKALKEALDVGLLEPHIFYCMLATANFPLHYLGDVYIRSIRDEQPKEDYFQRDRDPALAKEKYLDFVSFFYEWPTLVLKYLEDKHGIYVHLPPAGFFARRNASRFVKKYAMERRKGVAHRADDKHVARQFITLRGYWFLYCIIRASPLFVIRIAWLLYSKGFYLGPCVRFCSKVRGMGRR